MLRHATALYCGTFGGANKLIATAGRNGIAYVWEWGATRIVATLGCGHNRHLGPVWSAEFDATSQRLLTSGAYGTLRVWRIATGECLRVIDAGDIGTNGARRAVFAGGGRSSYVAASAMGGVTLWSLAAASTSASPLSTTSADSVQHQESCGEAEALAAVLRPLSGGSNLLCNDVDSRGAFILAAGADGVLRVWTCPGLEPPPVTAPSSPTRAASPTAAYWGKANVSLPPPPTPEDAAAVPTGWAQRLSTSAYVQRAGLTPLIQILRSRALRERPPTQIEVLRLICRHVDELLLRAQCGEREWGELYALASQAASSPRAPPPDEQKQPGKDGNSKVRDGDAASSTAVSMPFVRGDCADASHVVMGGFWEAFAESTCHRRQRR